MITKLVLNRDEEMIPNKFLTFVLLPKRGNEFSFIPAPNWSLPIMKEIYIELLVYTFQQGNCTEAVPNRQS